MDSSKIKAIIIVVVALIVALYLGIGAATAQFETIAWILGGATVAICFLMGRKIWLLIPFLGAVDFAVRIPGQPNSLLLAQALVLGFSALLFATRRLPYRLRFSEIEFWFAMIAIMAVQAYIRNPVGLSILGGSSIGGKYYFTFALAWSAAILLSGLSVEPKEIKTALKLSIVGGVCNFLVSIVAMFIPAVAFWTGLAYSSDSQSGRVDDGSAGRISGFSKFANNLALWVGSFRSPLLSLFHPVWGFVILFSAILAAASGFRSAVVTTGFIYLVCLFYRGRMPQVIISAVLGATGVVILALVNVITPLPPNIQRSLTFLPGTWEKRYEHDADGSTDWRVEMWEEVLLTDRWIQNKVLGDGLGFTARELNYQLSLSETGVTRIGASGFDMQREGVLASGGYHSVFVSSVRTCGYVGAVIFILAIARASLRAHRLITRARDTEWFATTLFFGVPIIIMLLWLPFSTLTFLQSASLFLYQAAMLRMLENNLPLPALATRALPSSFRTRPRETPAPGLQS